MLRQHNKDAIASLLAKHAGGSVPSLSQIAKEAEAGKRALAGRQSLSAGNASFLLLNSRHCVGKELRFILEYSLCSKTTCC